MSRLKRHVIGILAAATVAATGLAAPPSSSAMTLECSRQYALYITYNAQAYLFGSINNTYQQARYYGKAEEAMRSCWGS